MIFILITIITSSAIAVLFKLFQKFNINAVHAIIFNYITAVAAGIIINPISFDNQSQLPTNLMAAAAGLGAMFFVTLYLYAKSTQFVGVAITTILSRTSLVIPTFAAILLFAEPITWGGIVAIVMVIAALILIFKNNDNSKTKMSVAVVILPLSVFLMTGANDLLIKTSQQLFIKSPTDNALFISVVFAAALVFGVVSYLVTGSLKRGKLSWRSVGGGVVLGICNFTNGVCVLEALKHIKASVFFPINNTAIVLVSIFVGVYFFKEKLSATKMVGIVLALFAIIILATQ